MQTTMRNIQIIGLAPLALAALLAGCCQPDAPTAPRVPPPPVGAPSQALSDSSRQAVPPPVQAPARVTEQQPARSDDPALADDTMDITGIMDAIRSLEPGNPTHWTKAGKPRVKALEERLGYDISAADRDAAWQYFDAVTDAIRSLEPGNPAHWTKAGKPRVKALEEYLGYDISAADRDLAWRMSQ